jgi:hypothetical protein
LQGFVRHLAGLKIAPDHQQVLARRTIPAGRIIVQAAVAHIHAIDNGIPYRCAALDHSPAHGRYVAIEALPDNDVDYCRLQGLIDRTRPVMPAAKLQ